jgi:PAS domain S-box-containing protein
MVWVMLLGLLSVLAVAIAAGLWRTSRRMERELGTEKAYLEELFESSPQATVLADNNSVVLRANSEFLKLFGYTQEEVVGRPLDELVAPQERLPEAQDITRRVAGGERVTLETVRRRKDGSRVDVAILGAPVRIGGGQVAVYGVYRDITERRRSEEALKTSEEKFPRPSSSAPTSSP